jgi:phage-related protein
MFPIAPPLVKKIAPDLWEIRSKTANGSFRVFFTVAGQTLILLHGFVKKSQQTPREHLDTAKERLAEFRRLAQ